MPKLFMLAIIGIEFSIKKSIRTIKKVTLNHQNNTINEFFSQNSTRGITHIFSFALLCEKEVLLHVFLALLIK